MPDINDLLGAAINKEPVEFASALSDILSQKAAEAIEVRRIELAQGLYGDDTPQIDNDSDDVALDIDDFDPDQSLEDINGQDD